MRHLSFLTLHLRYHTLPSWSWSMSLLALKPISSQQVLSLVYWQILVTATTVSLEASLSFLWNSVCFWLLGVSNFACFSSFTVWREYIYGFVIDMTDFALQSPDAKDPRCTLCSLSVCLRWLFGYVYPECLPIGQADVFKVIMICYYTILCRPFTQYWALPVKNPQCATYATYSKIQMSFNISSDVFIILMPTSIIGRSKLPMKRKAILMVVFSLGVFTIICAILNK